MRLVRWTDPAEFAERVAGFLAEHEAENNLPLGLILALRDGAYAMVDPPLMATVEEAGQLLTVLLRTPPHNLILTTGSESRGADLAALLDDEVVHLPGVIGPSEPAGAFAASWCGRRGRQPTLAMAMTIYELTAVAPIDAPPGAARWATIEDLPTVHAWFAAFVEEATGDLPPAPEMVRRRIADQRILLWCDDDPVAMAGVARQTLEGACLAPVFTPIGQRRRGYATAVTATLCAWLRRRGLRRCFLFADQANASANGIYQRLGFAPVATAAHWRFGSRET